MICLASASPRRRELLDQTGVAYRVVAQSVPEAMRAGEAAEDYVLRLALAKARAGWDSQEGGSRLPVLGADTAVVVAGQILGKPRDRQDGLRMLEALSGCQHQVLTAVALVTAERQASRLSISRVAMREITPQERQAYWDSGEPADKAGAYAIQGRGAVFISRLEGSYSGVMGLPLFETAELLRDFGIDVVIKCYR